jgi:hypothetical protein
MLPLVSPIKRKEPVSFPEGEGDSPETRIFTGKASAFKYKGIRVIQF